jgi:hypothetical protein
MIHIQILTLPMDPMSGHFDTRELDQLQQTKRILSFREYLLTAEHAPRLVCVLECAKRNSSSPSEPISDPSNRYAVPEATPGPQQEASSSTPAQSPANADTQSKKKLNATDAQIAALSPAERELFDKLRHWRYQHAQAEGVPPYVVLTNRQLLAVVRSKPNRKSGLAPQPHGSLAQGCPIHPAPAARKPRPRCPRAPLGSQHGAAKPCLSGTRPERGIRIRRRAARPRPGPNGIRIQELRCCNASWPGPLPFFRLRPISCAMLAPYSAR